MQAKAELAILAKKKYHERRCPELRYASGSKVLTGGTHVADESRLQATLLPGSGPPRTRGLQPQDQGTSVDDVQPVAAWLL